MLFFFFQIYHVKEMAELKSDKTVAQINSENVYDFCH
jgi:hypothetical protein